jgi:hypothetical protein
MITIIVGVPRAGKSYKAVYDSLQGLADGVPQYVNWSFRLENVERWLRLRRGFTVKQVLKTLKLVHEVHDYEDMFSMFGHEHCHLKIDEAGDWFPAREHSVLPHEFLTYWRQHGKVGIDATLVAQTLSALDSQIRGLAAEIYVARPAPLFTKMLYYLRTFDPKKRVIHYTQTYDASDDGVQSTSQPKKSFRRHTLVLDYLAAGCYSSTQRFAPPFVTLKAHKNPAQAQLAEKLGIKFDESVLSKQRRQAMARDGLPFLNIYDTYDSSVPAHVRLRQRIDDELQIHGLSDVIRRAASERDAARLERLADVDELMLSFD